MVGLNDTYGRLEAGRPPDNRQDRLGPRQLVIQRYHQPAPSSVKLPPQMVEGYESKAWPLT